VIDPRNLIAFFPISLKKELFQEEKLLLRIKQLSSVEDGSYNLKFVFHKEEGIDGNIVAGSEIQAGEISTHGYHTTMNPTLQQSLRQRN